MLHNDMDEAATAFFSKKENRKYTTKALRFEPSPDALKIADRSFEVMVKNVDFVTFLDEANKGQTLQVSSIEKAEQALARIAAVEGKWPDAATQKMVMDQYDLEARVKWFNHKEEGWKKYWVARSK